MGDILLINDAYIKDNIPLNRNVDERKISLQIKLVQETYLPDLIGVNLYNELINKIDNGEQLDTTWNGFLEHVRLWLAVKVELEDTSSNSKAWNSYISKERVLNSRIKNYILSHTDLEIASQGEATPKFNRNVNSQLNTFYFL